MQIRVKEQGLVPALVLLVLFGCGPLFAQSVSTVGRSDTLLVTGWKFAPQPSGQGVEKPRFDDQTWQSVALPHTWNSKTQIVTHRAAWYRTHFALTNADKGREVFLRFDGAGTITNVYLNGMLLGTHRGAYTRFVFDATSSANWGGDNLLAVKCDTDPQDTADCLPSGNGYQLYHVPGGLYRRVHLLTTQAVHIDPTDHAASGVFLRPQTITTQSAALEIKTLVRNDSGRAQTVTVTNQVYAPSGELVATAAESLRLGSHTGGENAATVNIPQPHLWSPADPALYRVVTTTTSNGIVTDTLAEHTGLRFFRMTDSGFFLNGVRTPLRGVAKHQETEENGSAVTEADLRRDWDDLHDLGVNYVRLAHYPHASLEYDLADERGIVVWAENGHSNPADPTATGDEITREMVLQNYNHPCICFWSIGNEAIRKLSDITTLEHYAGIVRAEDPSRLVTYASNTTFHISPALDFVAVNRYLGWYGGSIAAFDSHAAYYHFISETGAGGVVSIHTAAAHPTHKVNLYEPEEYQQEVAESRCQTVFRDLSDEIPLFTWWTFRDFSDPRYKGVNSKGLATFSGFHKDSYFLFQSYLKPQTPLIYLCGKTWFLRRTHTPTDILTVKAYSNASTLTLTVNGHDLGMQENGAYVLPNGHRADNVFVWDDALQAGRNVVVVDDGLGHSDQAVIYAGQGEGSGLVENLVSSNPLNPASFLDIPVQAEWPCYDNFDGTGDNTFHAIPPVLDGARWITLHRPSALGMSTALTFTLAPDTGQTDIFLLVTASPAPPPGLLDGFADTHILGTWRDNALNLVPYALYCRTVSAGTTVHLPAAKCDYLVLVKPHL